MFLKRNTPVLSLFFCWEDRARSFTILVARNRARMKKIRLKMVQVLSLYVTVSPDRVWGH